MERTLISECSRCGNPLQQGFAARASGLSFIDPGKFGLLVFQDEDVSGAGLKKILPSKAEYFRSAICRSCKLYLVDYGQVCSRKQAEDAARSLLSP